jgi:hypothetical protein
MPDYVVDATVIGFANGDIAARRPGNVLDRRLSVIEQVVRGVRRLRYNRRLLSEYTQLVQEYRNDVIDAFFALLDDSRRAVLVRRSTLSAGDYDTARRSCRWPTHDQHLLAAALGGDDPTIAVTEARHARCAAELLRHFGVHIENLG